MKQITILLLLLVAVDSSYPLRLKKPSLPRAYNSVSHKVMAFKNALKKYSTSDAPKVTRMEAVEAPSNFARYNRLMNEWESVCKAPYQFFCTQLHAYIKLKISPKTFQEAAADCRKEGGDLLSPINKEVLHLMTIYIRRSLPCGSVYTGLHNTHTKKEIFSMEGALLQSLVPPLVWDYNCQSENIANLIGDDLVAVELHANGVINIVPQTRKLPYFCKVYDGNATNAIINNTVDEDCSCANEGYTYRKESDHCYKVFTTGKTWYDATKQCIEDKGHLVIFETVGELELIQNLISETKPEQYKDISDPDHFFIGFYFEKNEYVTVFKGPLSEMKYKPEWVEASSMLEPAEGVCGTMERSGRYANTQCGKTNAFVCKTRVF